jgi:uncharacterized protein (DUF2141 family)
VIAALLPLVAALTLAERLELGKPGAQCRADEQGPSIRIEVAGLKDRHGLLKLELYPSNDTDFLSDDFGLLSAGKPFRRVEIAVPQSGPVWICMRAPGAGTYALSLLHDRDANHKFGLSMDGVGFPGNPKMGWSKPSAATASVRVGNGPVVTRVIMNYRRGLFSFGPLKHQR